MLPLAPLAELPAHEQQLLPRMGPHVAEQEPEARELLPLVPGHLAEQRALAVHHLVVRERQHEILGEGVPEAEGQAAVVVLAVHRVLLEVLEGVVHPAHVPLQAEAEAAEVGGARDHRPGGRFLGDRLGVGMIAIGGEIELLDEFHRLEILVAAEAVGDPLPGAPSVVEVQHGGDRIDPQRIDVVGVEPEERVAGEEVAHLGAAVVEDGAVPLRMESLARVGVLVEVRAVEVREPVLVGREVRGDPVEDHADAAAVQVLDEVHEVLWRAVAGTRGEVAGDLVAPGAVEGVLHDRQQLDVREAELARVVGQLRRQLAVAEVAIALLRNAPPGAEMHLVDRPGGAERVGAGAVPHPLLVVPLEAQVPHDRGGARRHLGAECVRIALVDPVAPVAGGDVVLVERAGTHALHQAFPDPRGIPARRERRRAPIPAVEVADDRDLGRVRSPHGEARPADRAVGGAHRVGAELLVGPDVSAFAEVVDVLLRQQHAGKSSKSRRAVLV